MHLVIGEHSRSTLPGACGLDSYSPTAHSSVAAQTVLDVLVALVATYSSFLHSNVLRHAVLVWDGLAWYWPSGQLVHLFIAVLRYSPAPHLRSVVVVTVVADVEVLVEVVVTVVAVIVVAVIVVSVDVVAVVVGGGGPLHQFPSVLVQKQKKPALSSRRFAHPSWLQQ